MSPLQSKSAFPSRPEKAAMHNLVVCSATDPNDPTHSAMFSDFKKISSMLMLMETQTAMENIFLSCFPLEQRLNCLSIRTTPTTETKSGRPESSSGLGPVFTDHDRIRHKQVQEEAKLAGTSPDKDGAFHDEFIGWIKQKTQETQPGDMVNLFFSRPRIPRKHLARQKGDQQQ